MSKEFNVPINDEEAGVLLHVLAVIDDEYMSFEQMTIIDQLYYRISILKRDN